MTKRGTSHPLTASEYLVRNEDGQDDQMVGARWQFMEALGHVVPAFLELLRDQVYPEYARLTATNPDYWVMGWKLETWQLLSDRDNQLTPVLMAWARKFNVQGEDWILEGALQTLSYWHQFPEQRAALDSWGFRQWIAVSGLVSAEELRFRFSDGGWDPTFSSSTVWRTEVRKRFEDALDAHEQRMRKLVEERGAWPAVFRFSTDHFQWLALYQCGNLSLDSILHRAPHAADKTTISKGIHSAASLAAIAVRPKRRKLKKP
jgi:hypothetical protein